mmetsp:Transcript_1763/g.4965  ORF Transcript_1763/g.4965 Transcript_1763/m.4965 type:complete len:103 (+) Transcript_1763:65-373(+)
MLAVTRFSTRLARVEAPVLAARSRAFSIDKTLSERERAAESVYFAKEEKELLKRLSKKLGMPSPEQVESEESAVTKILSKHGVSASKEAVNEIITYFHTHPH